MEYFWSESCHGGANGEGELLDTPLWSITSPAGVTSVHKCQKYCQLHFFRPLRRCFSKALLCHNNVYFIFSCFPTVFFLTQCRNPRTFQSQNNPLYWVLIFCNRYQLSWNMTLIQTWCFFQWWSAQLLTYGAKFNAQLVGWVLSSRTEEGKFVSRKAHVSPPTHILSNQGDPLVVRPGSQT